MKFVELLLKMWIEQNVLQTCDDIISSCGSYLPHLPFDRYLVSFLLSRLVIRHQSTIAFLIATFDIVNHLVISSAWPQRQHRALQKQSLKLSVKSPKFAFPSLSSMWGFLRLEAQAKRSVLMQALNMPQQKGRMIAYNSLKVIILFAKF